MLRVKFNPLGPTKEYPSTISFLNEITGQDFTGDYKKYLSKVRKKLTKIFQGSISSEVTSPEDLLNTLVEMGTITILKNDNSPYMDKEYYSEMTKDFSRSSAIFHNLTLLNKHGKIPLQEKELLDLLHFFKFSSSYKYIRIHPTDSSISVVGFDSKVKEEKENWKSFTQLVRGEN